MIKELATYIANNTSLTLNSTLFAGEHPERMSNSACTVLEETSPGHRDGHPFLKDFGQTPFRLTVYGASGAGYFAARTIADELFTALHAITQVELPVVESGSTYLVNVSCNTPFNAGRDDNKRVMFVIYVTVTQETV